MSPSLYERATERSPKLLARLREAQGESLDLRSEVALARTALAEVMSQVSEIHQKSGKLSADGFAILQSQLDHVSKVVERAATIESKRVDQGIDVAKLVILMSSLRDDMRRNLLKAGLNTAVPYIDAAFERAKWSGDLDDETIEKILAAPASYDVEFRPIEREGDKPIESRETVKRPEDALREPTVDDVAKTSSILKSSFTRIWFCSCIY